LGLDPVFIPSRCGIKGAEIWEGIAARNYPEQLAALKKAIPGRIVKEEAEIWEGLAAKIIPEPITVLEKDTKGK
jgi:hypothetical protein